ncbi:hypothetical protein J6590_046335 [Homalodisca vitripennis]|nr:hypothetical protein J6590_046335 [Homalodisca vitripennis]
MYGDIRTSRKADHRIIYGRDTRLQTRESILFSSKWPSLTSRLNFIRTGLLDNTREYNEKSLQKTDYSRSHERVQLAMTNKMEWPVRRCHTTRQTVTRHVATGFSGEQFGNVAQSLLAALRSRAK